VTRDGSRLQDHVVFGDGSGAIFTHARECNEHKCHCQEAFGTWLVRMVRTSEGHEVAAQDVPSVHAQRMAALLRSEER